MGVTAVIGLQWGDEGKGKIVDVLSRSADVVARCQGGANAGHTVVIDGTQHILHLIPSGILRESTTCLIGNGMAVDLDVLAGEIRQLADAGITTSGRLIISRRAHVVLPLHKQLDLLEEEPRGKSKLGTTRRGIGPCYSDKYSRLGIRVGDVLEPGSLKARIETMLAAHGKAAHGMTSEEELARGSGSASDAAMEGALEDALEYCAKHEEMLSEFAGDVVAVLRQSLQRGEEVLLEGSQGFLLDIDHGTYPFVTSCSTGIHGLASGVGLAPSDIGSVIGVVKSYMTRVGEGILPTLMEEPYQMLVRDRGKEYGATTGRPRRCGWLDLPAIRYACGTNGVTSVAVTKLDTLSRLDGLKVCTSYDRLGACVEHLSPEVEFLSECKPCYASCETWGDIGAASTVDELPGGAREYIDRILEAAGCRLELLSTGPGREQIVKVAR